MRLSRFAQYAWFNVVYTVGVILWGAVVRATGSGAGCGAHWPTCNGEVIPQAPEISTLIEFGHRLTSGLVGIFAIVLVVWAWRAFERGSRIRFGSALFLVFTIIEGGLGAMLVRLELVEDNASVLRAVVIALHLLNTLILLYWITLTAWAASRPEQNRPFQPSLVSRLLTVAAVTIALLSSAGAVTALGDTLFLSGALAEQVGAENVADHFLIQLRVIHPVMAVAVAVGLFALAMFIFNQPTPPAMRRLTWVMLAILAGQMSIGLLTIALKAPVLIQLLHLLLADSLWIVALLLTFEARTSPQRQAIALNPEYAS
ncbi:MAG: COX15/CtaA family protein [Phototrophicaceae bacterium]|jgi:heme A synthase